MRTRVQLTAPLRGQHPDLEKRGGTTLGRNEKSPQDLQGDARVQTGWPSPLPGTSSALERTPRSGGGLLSGHWES